MPELYSNTNSNFKIIQNDNNEYLYCIEFNYPCQILCNSLVKTKILRGATISEDYKQIVFKAYSVQMYNELDKKYGIHLSAIIADSLSAQLKYMVDTYNVTTNGFNTEKIIVIDDIKAAFLDDDLIAEIDNDSCISIHHRFDVSNFFFSPEMKNINKLPARVNYKTTYFSLGCLLLHALLGREVFEDFYQEYLLDSEDLTIKKYLDTCAIRETKLYWLICRCLVQEPEKRSILFI
jgi:hypothetical protein